MTRQAQTLISVGLALVFAAPASGTLVLTGVIDGPLTGGLPKAVELLATADIAELNIYGIGSANNGGGSDGEEFTFPAGPLSAGSFLYVASELTEFTNWFGFSPDFTSSAANVNGDDAIELFMNGSVIDVFGDIDVDGTGQPWEYLDGWAYRTDDTGPDGSTFELANWTFSGPNALDGETTNSTAAVPFPVGSYTRSDPPAPGIPEPCSLQVWLLLAVVVMTIARFVPIHHGATAAFDQLLCGESQWKDQSGGS